MKNKTDFIVYLSTYPPRKCGIASFTQDLAAAIDKIANPKIKSKIIALNDDGNSYDYSDKVLYQIKDIDIKDYVKVAQKINKNNKIKLVSIQHEFKIFGSDYGENLLVFLEKLKKPIVTTFHTVLPYPSGNRKKIIRSIAGKSDCLIVMSKYAVEILRRDYGPINSKIVVIPHGIHDAPYKPNTLIKEQLGYADKQIITSFGFLRPGRNECSSGRGYEYVLDALPNVIKKFPNVLYLIIGITHPNTLKREGGKYRHSLKRKVKELGLEKHVKFINKHLPLNKLLNFLQASDICISSALNPDQIVSGTLAYAMGCGRPVIATPFAHAKEAITSKTGIIVELRNPKSYAKAIIKLLSNPELRNKMGRNAYSYTRPMIWPNIASDYKKVFENYSLK